MLSLIRAAQRIEASLRPLATLLTQQSPPATAGLPLGAGTQAPAQAPAQVQTQTPPCREPWQQVRWFSSAPDKTRRFYERARVIKAQDGSDGYTVTLDSRPVRTPARNVLTVPSYPLALALAAEWQWQPTGKPQMHTMPLMSLAATAIDEPKPRAKVIENLLKYVHTDATCCRLEKGSKVAQRQAELVAGELGWRLAPSHDLFGPYQPEETVATVKRFLEGLNPYELAAIDQLTAVSKSLVIAAALLLQRISIQDALRAARVEEDCQIEEWGSVEAGHDLDQADYTTRIASAAVFLKLLQLK